MRFLYAFLAMLAWAFILEKSVESGAVVSDSLALLTLSIVAAGGLAGKS